MVSDSLSSIAAEPALVVLMASGGAALISVLGVVAYRFGRSWPRLVGWAEALASGLMLGAAHLVISHGLDRDQLVALVGAALGVLYTLGVQRYAGTAELADDVQGDPGPEYGYKVLLQQTLHSSSEGVAIGVAMILDLRLGLFLAASLAVHNVAEATVLADVLRRRGLPGGQAAGLCVVTKLTQPLFALALFALAPVLFGLLSGALGFAAGCLAFLVLTELLPDAYLKGERIAIATLATLAAGVVVLLEDFLA